MRGLETSNQIRYPHAQPVVREDLPHNVAAGRSISKPKISLKKQRGQILGCELFLTEARDRDRVPVWRGHGGWRIEYEGAYYHLLSRGNERRDIFLDDDDQRLYLDTLANPTEADVVQLHISQASPDS
jgi:hypothetical protein